MHECTRRSFRLAQVTPGTVEGRLQGLKCDVSVLSEPLVRAYAACEAVARSHYENFPVASRLLPRAMRPHVAAVYAFARVADDFADEGSESPVDRQRRLAAWRTRLHRAAENGGATEAATRDDLI